MRKFADLARSVHKRDDGDRLAAMEEEAGQPGAGIQTKERWAVKIYNDHQKLKTLWRQFELSGYCSVFQSYDCAAAWYDAAILSGAADPLIVVVSEKEGEVMWLLPLCLSRHKGRKGLKVISFADLGVSDYAAPLIAPNAPADRKSVLSMFKAVRSALPPCDLIHFQKLVSGVQGLSNPLLLLSGQEIFPAKSYGVRITEPWAEQARQVMQPRLRSTIKQKKTALNKKATVAFSHYDDPESLRPALERLMEMQGERFKTLGLPVMPALWRRFYQVLAERDNRKIAVSITEMTIDGEVVAACFGLMRGKTYYMLLTSFKMGAWESYRPGMLLFDYMLTRFAEQTRYDGYFDFTVGDEVYKKRFGCDSHLLYEWMQPQRFKAVLYYITWRLKAFLRRYPELFIRLQKLLHCLRSFKRKTK